MDEGFRLLAGAAVELGDAADGCGEEAVCARRVWRAAFCLGADRLRPVAAAAAAAIAGAAITVAAVVVVTGTEVEAWTIDAAGLAGALAAGCPLEPRVSRLAIKTTRAISPTINRIHFRRLRRTRRAGATRRFRDAVPIRTLRALLPRAARARFRGPAIALVFAG
ncbi:MAG: hypothetical protein JO304_12345 [Solirubrobacterales bacterium]|nr:hypothetical protein [Solirubrobacterales bacterium]